MVLFLQCRCTSVHRQRSKGTLGCLPASAHLCTKRCVTCPCRAFATPEPRAWKWRRDIAWGPAGILGCPVSPCMSTSAPALRYPWLLAVGVEEVWRKFLFSTDAARDAMVLFLQCRGYKWPYATLEGHLRMSAGPHAPAYQTVCNLPLPGIRHTRSREVNIPNRLKSAHMCTKLCVTAPAEPPPYPKPRDEEKRGWCSGARIWGIRPKQIVKSIVCC